MDARRKRSVLDNKTARELSDIERGVDTTYDEEISFEVNPASKVHKAVLKRYQMRAKDEATWRFHKKVKEFKEELQEACHDKSEDEATLVATTLAEKELVRTLTIPPTYQSWSNCFNCGPVPVPRGTNPALPFCPWCEVFEEVEAIANDI